MKYVLILSLAFFCSGCDYIDSNEPDPNIDLNIAWSSIGSPYGGNVRSSILTKSNTIVANVDNNLYWKSLNENTWHLAVGPHANFHTNIYEDGNGVLYGGRWDTLFTSLDGGKSWSSQTFGSNIYRITSDTQNGVYLLTEQDGIKYTENGGVSWRTFGFNSRNFLSLFEHSISSFDVSDNGDLYFGTVLSGLYKYLPETDQIENIFSPGSNIRCLQVDRVGVIYLLTNNGLWRSVDQGNSWVSIAGNWDPRLLVSTFDLDEEGKLYAIISSHGFYYSSDKGGSWELSPGSNIVGVSYIDALNSEQVLIGTHEGLWLAGIQRSNPEHIGVVYTKPGAVFTIDGNAFWGSNATIGLGSLFRQDSNSDAWTKVASSGAITSWTTTSLDGSYFMGTHIGFEASDGMILRSGDRGINWSAIQLPTGPVNAMTSLPSGEVIAGVGKRGLINEPFNGGVHLSKNGGETWDFTELGITVTALTTLRDNTIIAGGSSGEVGYVFVSSDKGKSWNKRKLSDRRPQILSLTTDSRGHLFAGTLDNGIFRSRNSGRTWESVSPGLQDASVYSIHAGLDGFVYAGTESGFYVSSNGIDWNLSGNAMKNEAILEITTDENNAIYAATRSLGVFKGEVLN